MFQSISLLFSQYNSTWFYRYHNPGGPSDNVECPTDIFGVPDGNRAKMVSFAYDKRYVHKWKSLI